MIGSKIGRYDILKLLGQGAMAIVYEAYDPLIDRTLAIKMLREERCLDEENRSRFLREAKSAGNLSHPHIVTIHDIGEENNRPYIVMELLEGATLDEILESGQHISISDTVDIGVQLATALHYAHEYGVVHRDIKPSNIVCTNSEKEKFNVKITDFGIAHVTDSNLTQGTEAGALLGTPFNISPEQVLGTTIDGRADLFSLGITLYHLFCGQRPFMGSNLHALMLQIATEDHRPITHVKSDFPLQLRSVIDKCLQKDPIDRYQTGEELANGLRQATDSISKHGAKTEKHRSRSSVFKQTLFVSLLLLATLTVTAISLISYQQASIQQEITSLGIGFSQYVAKQNTESVVRQDWLAVELFIQHIGSPQQITRVSITDHLDKIRGDTLSSAVDTQYNPLYQIAANNPKKLEPEQVLIISRHSNAPVTYAGVTMPRWLSQALNLTQYNEFHATMSYGERHVGKVIVSMSPSVSYKPLLDALSIVLLLCFVCAATVIPAVYYVSRSNAKSLKLLQNSMNDIASGNYSQRISSVPLNETGETYIAYNNMADKIQQRDHQYQTSQQQAQQA